MALTTPIVAPVSYFDAAKAHTFTFSIRGGDQVTGNTITIKNNATLETVYTNAVTTFKLEHTVPAGTLTNGTYYQVIIQTKNAAGDLSNESAPVQFYCYAEPSFGFTNIQAEGTVGNSSYSFNVRYNNVTPNSNEYLNEYVFNLYNAAGTLLSTSSAMYNSNKTLPLDISYLFSGLADKTIYMVECTGVTTGGRELSTGLVEFSTSYTQPSLYSYIYLTNNCQEGYITIECNVVAIIGKTTPDEPVYTDDGTAIDLTGDGASVIWDDGYQITNGNTTRLWGRKFTPNSEIMRFSNVNGDTVALTYREDATKAWYELMVKNIDFTWAYIIQSEQINKPEDTDMLFAWIRQVGDLYDIIIENMGVSA